MAHPVRLFSFGTVEYRAALRWQHETADAVRNGAGEALALLQHPPVYTLGRLARHDNVLVDAEMLRARGASVVQSDRGGDVTFHGPGQLVCYPILSLRRRQFGTVDYVRALEDVMLQALRRFGLRGQRIAGRPGVWLDGAKAGAVGVRVQGGVTTHGLALNVDCDLAWFDAIVPCGLRDARVTSMAEALGCSPGVEAVAGVLVEAFADVFDATLVSETVREARLGTPPSFAKLRMSEEMLVAHGR